MTFNEFVSSENISAADADAFKEFLTALAEKNDMHLGAVNDWILSYGMWRSYRTTFRLSDSPPSPHRVPPE